MNIVDIIVSLILLYSLWQGWSSGVLVQLSGIIGLVAGTWAAYRFTDVVEVWMKIDPTYHIGVFIAVLLAVLIGVIILCQLATRLLESGGLSLPIKLAGAVASALKFALIMALALKVVLIVNRENEFFDIKYLEQARAYEPITKIANYVFPYITQLYQQIQ